MYFMNEYLLRVEVYYDDGEIVFSTKHATFSDVVCAKTAKEALESFKKEIQDRTKLATIEYFEVLEIKKV